MSKFEQYLTEAKTRRLAQTRVDKIAKSVRRSMKAPKGDKYDDPYTFLNVLVNQIESAADVKVSEEDQDRFRNQCKNRKQDVYIKVDKCSQTLEFVEDGSGKVGYVHVAVYNDPGKDQNTDYECTYYFG